MDFILEIFNTHKKPHLHRRMTSATHVPFWMKCIYIFIYKWVTQNRKWRMLYPQLDYFALNRSFDNAGRATPVRFPITGFPLLS